MENGIFYENSIAEAQWGIATENSPDAVESGDFVFDNNRQDYEEILTSSRCMTKKTSVNPIIKK